MGIKRFKKKSAWDTHGTIFSYRQRAIPAYTKNATWRACYSLMFLDKMLQEGPQDSLSGTSLTSTLMSTWCHACDSFSQAFPHRFCILHNIHIKYYTLKLWRAYVHHTSCLATELMTFASTMNKRGLIYWSRPGIAFAEGLHLEG